MQLGMIGLGRMGANMVRRLIKGGHECVVYVTTRKRSTRWPRKGGGRRVVRRLRRLESTPARYWLMVPAAVVDATLQPTSRPWPRATSSSTAATRTTSTTSGARRRLARRGIHYVEVGTSGGVWGLGARLLPDDRRRAGRSHASTRSSRRLRRSRLYSANAWPREHGRHAPRSGYLHCGPNGAGHFVKMVHNGIEYGIMAAYAEGLNILRARQRRASAGARSTRRRRRFAIPSTTSTTSTSPTSPRCGGAAASSPRGCWT